MRNLVFIVFIFLHGLKITCMADSIRSDLKRRPPPNKFVSIQAACTRDVIMMVAVMQNPFHGMAYARGYPSSCHVTGDGTKEISLTLNASSCGVKIYENNENRLIQEVFVYIQHDAKVQQAIDEQILVSCTPVDSFSVATNGFGRSILQTESVATGRKVPLLKDPTMKTSILRTTKFTNVECRMNIIRGGSISNGEIRDHLKIGEQATMVIRIRQPPGLYTKVTDCVAHDGSDSIQQELINSDGCAVDYAIMPPLQERVNPHNSALKFVYAHFSAFKFPEKSHLHLKCKIHVCLGPCPEIPCALLDGRRTSAKKNDMIEESVATERFDEKNKFMEEFDVFNSVEVRAPEIEFDAYRQIAEESSVARLEMNGFCWGTSRFVLTFGVLIGITIIAFVFSFSICIWARKIRLPGDKKFLFLSDYSPHESHM